MSRARNWVPAMRVLPADVDDAFAALPHNEVVHAICATYATLAKEFARLKS